ncbi:uncharacterized protein HKW66_Vig0089040 [Vigna angularis]|uniref:Uncharacterized protein n=1 Tax=Phaseolus angularis TaxID=3914 RepID=A0A8T0KKY4_PHAAN|nr:uncharacterized protein HKW66_Vig0089040 [Vigna angularis]
MVDDLHSVVQHFHESNRVIRASVGHSKGGYRISFVLAETINIGFLYLGADQSSKEKQNIFHNLGLRENEIG